MVADRDRLKVTFDSAARLYEQARPGYPAELYDELVRRADLSPGDRLLERPGGRLAFWTATHVFPAGGDTFFTDIQEVYDEIGEGLPPGAIQPVPGELPDAAAEIEGSGYFEHVVVRQFDWEVSYSAEEYVRLLSTFSGHIAMDAWKRDRLYGEIRRRLGERRDGRLRRHWGAALHIARRRAVPAP